MADPLLQYYSDETWGYDVWDEEKKLQNGLEVLEEQKWGEDREEYFDRIGKRPGKNEYGSKLNLDKSACGASDDREWCAKQGHALEKLVHDEDWHVRRAVAEQGYGLDILIKDKNPEVRVAVVDQGWGLDGSDDRTENIRRSTMLQLYSDESFGYDLWDEERKLKAGLDVLEEQQEDESNADFFERIGIAPKKNMYGSIYKLDILVHDKSYEVLKALVKQGYGLDALVGSELANIRIAVAEQGYGLDTLIDDADWHVRKVVADQGYGLDRLVNDENEEVRAAVARQGFGLKKLIRDKDWYVRLAVAEQEYGLEVLIYDENEEVRAAARALY